MSKRNERTLYECANAKVRGEPVRIPDSLRGRISLAWLYDGKKIACAKGHPLGLREDGSIDIRRLARGDRLGLKACQECPNFNWIGEPVPDSQKGWVGGRAPAARARSVSL